MLPVHQRLIHWLEERGDLDRALEFLPSDGEIERRRQRGPGAQVAGVLGAGRLRQARAQGGPHALRRSPTTRGSSPTLADYFPEPIRERYRRRARRAPAAPRDHHQRGGQLDGQPRRDHLRVPGRSRRPARRRSRSPARSWCAARCSACRLSSRDVEALDNVVTDDVQTVLYLEFRRLLDRAIAVVPHVPPVTLDVVAEVARFAGSVAEFAPRMPRDAAGCASGERMQRRTQGAGEGRRADATAARAASPARPVLAARRRRHRRRTPVSRRRGGRAASTSWSRSSSASTLMLTRVTSCRVTTGGTRWPAARCATTCTPCSSRWSGRCIESSDSGEEPLARYEQWATPTPSR